MVTKKILNETASQRERRLINNKFSYLARLANENDKARQRRLQKQRAYAKRVRESLSTQRHFTSLQNKRERYLQKKYLLCKEGIPKTTKLREAQIKHERFNMLQVRTPQTQQQHETDLNSTRQSMSQVAVPNNFDISHVEARIRLHKIAVFKRNFVCSICCKNFPSSCKQYFHTLIHKESTDKNIQGRNFEFKETKLPNRLINDDPKIIKDPIIRKHDTDIHNKIDINKTKKFKCDKCNYKFEELRALEFHKMLHSGVKLFKCAKCDYTCRYPSYLQLHDLRRHSNKKPFKCDECDYACKRITHLVIHKRKHSGEKPFKCDICSSAFTTYASLKNHMLIFSKLKSLYDDEFSSTYAQSDKLRSPETTRALENSFRCNICEYTCTEFTLLKQHKMTHTAEKLLSAWNVTMYVLKES